MTFLFVLLLLAAPVQVTPPRATVGDRVVLTYPIDASSHVSVDESPDYDLVAVRGNEVTLRSFKPGELIVSARIERPGTATELVETRVRIESVLAKGDKLQPALLRPPRPIPAPGTPWKAIAVAALAAALAWAAVWFRASRKEAAEEPAMPLLAPDEEFRRRLDEIRAAPPADERWADLADAVRKYLARSRPELGLDLTTSEIVRKLRRSGAPLENGDTVSIILSEADWVKFSPWSSRRQDLGQLLDRAAELLPRDEPPQTEAA